MLLSGKKTATSEAESFMMEQMLEAGLASAGIPPEIAEKINIESIKKLIGKFSGKAISEVSKVFGDDEILFIIRKDKASGQVYIMVCKTDGVKSLDLREESFKIVLLEDIIDMLRDGKFDAFEKFTDVKDLK